MNLFDSLLELYKSDKINYLLEYLRGEQAVLFLLSQNYSNVKDITNKLGIKKNRMSAILNSLDKKELVIINKDISDKRRYIIKLTDKGLNLINDKNKKAEKIIKNTLKDFTSNDQLKLIDIINKINKGLEGLNNE